MDALKAINAQALIKLKGSRPYLTAQQYKTLRGQVLAGNADAAMQGLKKIQERRRTKP